MSNDSYNSVYDAFFRSIVSDPSLTKKFSKFIPHRDETFINLVVDLNHTQEFQNILDSGMYPELQYNVLNPGARIYQSNYILMANAVMIYHYQSMNMKESLEREILLHNKEYQKRLECRVLSQMKSRCLLTDNEKSMIYAYTPPLYYIHGVVNELTRTPKSAADDKIKKETLDSKNFSFKYITITDCLELVRSICTLIELNEYSNAYALLRTLIEMIITYVAIKDKSPKTVNKYLDTQKDKKKYDSSAYQRAKIEKSLIAQGKKTSINEINYNWLDYFPLSTNKYGKTFKSVLKIKGSREDQKFKVKWYKMYEYCNHYVHANYFRCHADAYHYFTLTCALSELTIFLANEYKTNFNVSEIKVDGIDVVKSLEDVFNEEKELRKNADPIEITHSTPH